MSGPVDARRIAASLSNGQLPQAQAPRVAKAVAVDPQAKAVIDDLFSRLKGCHPGWRQAWPDSAEEGAAKREWLAAFVQAGIQRVEQIQYGIRIARQSSGVFVPSVGSFIAWCFAPEAFGLPPVERAYVQAMRNTHPSQAADARWTHDAIYHACVASGFSTLQRLPRETGMKLFEKHYLAVCSRLGRGEQLPAAPVAALPAPASKGDAGVGNAALAGLRAKLKGVAQ